MENHQIKLKHKQEVFDTLKEALTLVYKNNSFLAFTFLSSLPLFCLSVYYELLLQRTLVQISEFVRQQRPGYFDYNWQTLLHTATKMTELFSNSLIRLGVLYLVPLHFLDLSTVLVTVHVAAKIYVQEKTVRKPNFSGTFVTSIWVLFLSTCTVLGSIWLVSIYYVILRNSGYIRYLGVLYLAGCMALLAKYQEWSSVWNMGIVISILEDSQGSKALLLSAHLSRGNEKQGLALALVFFVWGLGLRGFCLFFGCHERGNGIVAQIGLFCMLNVVKWVAYMIYFFNCKKWTSKKKVDQEMGKVEKCNQRTEKTEPVDVESLA